MPDMKTEGVNIGEVASKLDNIQILSCEKPDIIAKLKKGDSFHQSQERLRGTDAHKR